LRILDSLLEDPLARETPPCRQGSAQLRAFSSRLATTRKGRLATRNQALWRRRRRAIVRPSCISTRHADRTCLARRQGSLDAGELKAKAGRPDRPHFPSTRSSGLSRRHVLRRPERPREKRCTEPFIAAVVVRLKMVSRMPIHWFFPMGKEEKRRHVRRSTWEGCKFLDGRAPGSDRSRWRARAGRLRCFCRRVSMVDAVCQQSWWTRTPGPSASICLSACPPRAFTHRHRSHFNSAIFSRTPRPPLA